MTPVIDFHPLHLAVSLLLRVLLAAILILLHQACLYVAFLEYKVCEKMRPSPDTQDFYSRTLGAKLRALLLSLDAMHPDSVPLLCESALPARNRGQTGEHERCLS
jgi:hypothetical protein